MAEHYYFDPTYLYDAAGHMEQVTDPQRYHALLDAGWKDSPAAFGIETCPNRPQQQMLESVFGPVADVARTSVAQQGQLKQVEEALLQMQTVLGSIQDTQNAMHMAMGQLQNELLAANDANQKLHARLTAVEGVLTQPPQPPAPGRRT